MCEREIVGGWIEIGRERAGGGVQERDSKGGREREGERKGGR